MKRVLQFVGLLALGFGTIGCDNSGITATKQEECVCPVTGWMEYSPPDGRFSVILPASPLTSVSTNSTAAGPIIYSKFTTELSGTVAFAVIHSAFSDGLDISEEAGFFEGGLKGAIGKDGRLVSEAKISLQEYPGREWRLEKLQGQATVVVRIYLVDRELYQLMCVMPSGRVCDQHVRQFLDSFRVMTD